jgi:hypothetical protein
MKNINPFQLSTVKTEDYTYRIDWSLFEGEIEYDMITEELKVVTLASKHAFERMEDFKISFEELEEVVNKAAGKLIKAFNRDEKKYTEEIVATIRDRSKKIPYELIVIMEPQGKHNKVQKTVKKEEIAMTGEIFDRTKLRRIKDNYDNKNMYLDGEPSKGLRTHSYKEILDQLDKEKKDIENIDYLFRVYTTRRKKKYLPNNANQYVIDIYPNNVDLKHSRDMYEGF